MTRAIEADALFGLHPYHFQQANQHAELVPSGELGQGRDGLGDEQSCLFGPAISRWLVGS
jgi:hypothetical protein